MVSFRVDLCCYCCCHCHCCRSLCVAFSLSLRVLLIAYLSTVTICLCIYTSLCMLSLRAFVSSLLPGIFLSLLSLVSLLSLILLSLISLPLYRLSLIAAKSPANACCDRNDRILEPGSGRSRRGPRWHRQGVQDDGLDGHQGETANIRQCAHGEDY